MLQKNKHIHGVWNSRFTFVLAATGSAVGLGNLWKFPYVVGQNGGGAFILCYLLFLFLIAMPVMLAEVMLGRHGRQSPINSLRLAVQESGVSSRWAYVGWFGLFSGLLILAFYGVVAGWAIQYLIDFSSGDLQAVSPQIAAEHFRQLIADPKTMMLWQGVFTLLIISIVNRGVRRGLGVAVRWMIPTLFILLGIMLWFSSQAGAFSKSIDFLFTVDFSTLTMWGIVDALGLALFTLSLGMGAMIAYGAYIPSHVRVTQALTEVVILDTVVTLVFAIVVFSVVFANPELQTYEGPGLIFVTLPVAFANMGGGLLLGSALFLLLIIAALSSAISLFEPAVAWLVESTIFNRLSANFFVGGVTWSLGGVLVNSFGYWDNSLDSFTFLNNVALGFLLPISGLLIAIFVGWKMQAELVREELHEEPIGLYKCWYWFLKYLSPASIILILIAGIISLFVR